MVLTDDDAAANDNVDADEEAECQDIVAWNNHLTLMWDTN